MAALETYFGTAIAQQKATVVYNYVDFSETASRPAASCCRHHCPDAFYLERSPASKKQESRLTSSIQAYAALRQDGVLSSNTKLVVVGSSGPETEAIQQLIQTHSLQKQVRLLSSISDSELCWLYKHCQLFVIPSSTEGFCIPLVEALSLGAKRRL